MRRQHYVFGYGSLICAESRAATASVLGEPNQEHENENDGRHIPVRLRRWVRLWNVRGPNTYLGVQKLQSQSSLQSQSQSPLDAKADAKATANHSCIGVLVPIPSSGDDETDLDVLEALDQRERGYDRHMVDLESVERVDDLLLSAVASEDDDNDSSNDIDNDNNSDDPIISSSSETSKSNNDSERSYHAIEDKYYKHTFLRRTTASELSDADADANVRDVCDVCIWIYVPKVRYTGMARPENPILQSYVDVCLKGCLSISVCFAREFVRSTYGWYPGHGLLELPSIVVATANANANAATARTDDPNGSNDDDNDDDDDDDDDQWCWIDDRKYPVYLRADKIFSTVHSERVDAFFDSFLLGKRRSYEPIDLS